MTQYSPRKSPGMIANSFRPAIFIVECTLFKGQFIILMFCNSFLNIVLGSPYRNLCSFLIFIVHWRMWRRRWRVTTHGSASDGGDGGRVGLSATGPTVEGEGVGTATGMPIVLPHCVLSFHFLHYFHHASLVCCLDCAGFGASQD